MPHPKKSPPVSLKKDIVFQSVPRQVPKNCFGTAMGSGDMAFFYRQGGALLLVFQKTKLIEQADFFLDDNHAEQSQSVLQAALVYPHPRTS